MDIIAFPYNYITPTFHYAEVVNGWDSVEWVERYREPGSFVITARLDSGLRSVLYPGRYISHVDTDEVMVVENVEINQNENEHPIITISGRSALVIMEKRIMGSWKLLSTPQNPPTVTVTQIDPWPDVYYFGMRAFQAAWNLMNETFGTQAYDYGERVPSFRPSYQDGTWSFAHLPVLEIIKSNEQTVWGNLSKFLAMENFGVRTRRNRFRDYPYYSLNFEVFPGWDKTKEVSFTQANGDLSSAKYLVTNKNMHDTFFVKTSAVNYVRRGIGQGLTRRVYFIDGSDIDADYVDDYGTINYPTSTVNFACESRIQQEMQQMQMQDPQEIQELEIDRTKSRYRYRVDYDIGDIVTVATGFDDPAPKRVVSHVEIQDDTGEFSYPTFEAPNDYIWGYNTGV